MSFGTGMAVGMGAGIGAGMAMGMSSGQQQAVNQVREYLLSHELSIHDRMGTEVEIEAVLSEAVGKRKCCKRTNFAFVAILGSLVGTLVLGVLGYLAFF